MTRDERLKEIEERYKRGTKGKWYWEATGPSTVKIWAEDPSGDELVCDKIYIGDAEIITEAKPDVKFLLSELRRLEVAFNTEKGMSTHLSEVNQAIQKENAELKEHNKKLFTENVQLREGVPTEELKRVDNYNFAEDNRIERIIRQQAVEHSKSLQSKLDVAVKALEYLVKNEAQDGSGYACTFCDMGGAGYSSKGDGHHDDTRGVCPVAKAREALATLEGK